jgi:hypothetical protein
MTRRAALAVVALSTALLASCGGGGDGSGGSGDGQTAKANDPFYGVISAEPLPGDTELARLGGGGVGTLRVNLAWAYAQSGPGAPYDWSHYDPVVANAASHGIRVLATVYGSPAWAEATSERPPLGGELRPFESFVKAAVDRYGSDGSFWPAHPDVPKLPVTDWQLWNEPNSPLFWKPTPDAGQYQELLGAFHAAVKGADPRARVVLGGLFPTPTGGPPMEEFIADLYRAGGGRLFDAAAVHPYAGTPREAIRMVERARAVMSRFGERAKPIWITEVGWASGGAASGLTVGPGTQAKYLKRTFTLAANERNRLAIAGVVWYSLNDTPGPLWVGHCGLFDLAGQPKPAWGALAKLTGGTT